MQPIRQAELFRELARKAHGGSFANQWAEADAAKTLIKAFESITTEEATDMIRALQPHYAAGDSLKDRLTRLMDKLENDGLYTDANTCWLALEQLKND
ncbi:hypothetical protein [Mesorhizobium sp. M8A.F.Ca.ET.021.01.1.1]|uniref:hypothetical protein n=1 Tax=Mesorhizobium sp. M8A.F.Ca.ET.021.01.1.1 TaxID=2496757 RepID=UPI000FCBFC2F|nr:hypothetical protein [Mesorhizobium sp. M8A.F.Ca.ET.021.01.1.1]RUW57163.1 hypothetical protein EOA36_00845 [Mesorhizobium sp. M8A.F.Ca.ET.021.01.1.1]